MPRSTASFSSGVSSFSMEMQPLTWKPPMATSMPFWRNWRAIAMARGNWFDCTPTRQTRPPWPGLRILAAIFSTGIRMFISS